MKLRHPTVSTNDVPGRFDDREPPNLQADQGPVPAVNLALALGGIAFALYIGPHSALLVLIVVAVFNAVVVLRR